MIKKIIVKLSILLSTMLTLIPGNNNYPNLYVNIERPQTLVKLEDEEYNTDYIYNVTIYKEDESIIESVTYYNEDGDVWELLEDYSQDYNIYLIDNELSRLQGDEYDYIEGYKVMDMFIQDL